MQQTSQSKHVLGRGTALQSALQKQLARVQSTINNVTSLKHAPGRTIHDLEQIAQRGSPLSLDDLPAFADAIAHMSGTINDREFLLEKILTMMARLPDDSEFGKLAQHHIISLLYRDLPHPPTGFLSTFHNHPSTIEKAPAVSYAFRSADGSNYNVLLPSLGQAGQPYARSVPSTHIPTIPSLPDSGVVFDSLLSRPNDDFVSHPGGLSSLFFAFADLIIHTIFNTNMMDWTINDANSYIDLAIIYGNSEQQLDAMRKKDGTGKIWNDAFADSRLLFMPPAVCALAVLFSRHHNYVAQKILELNERGSFTSPPPDEKKSRLAQDDEIFHRARLVNTGFFMQLILADYVGAILGLVRDGLTWRLDILQAYRESNHRVSPRGEGNAVSIEFNLLYRWHASISKQDEKWLNGMFGNLFDGRDPKTVTLNEFRTVVRKKRVPPGNIKNWTFGGLERGPDGSFSGNDLARILQDATEAHAGAFRARGCPPAMRVIEILAIEQGRKWGACTLNEFRNFFGLRPYESFQEWNPDPAVYSVAETLYGHIDNLELHVGLQAEETKPPMPGAGMCPGFTISRAILADAICLTRGDRFLTVDFTPYNLTSWGYQHCMINKDDGAYSGMLNRLLFTLLPDQYPAGSAYAQFPFLTPDFMRPSIAARSPNNLAYYDFSRPSPVGLADNDRRLDVLYRRRISTLTGGVKEVLPEVRKCIVDETLSGESFAKMFAIVVKSLSTSASQNAKVVDIVKDVINRLPIYWAANFVIGLPTTLFDTVWGGHTVAQWTEMFADVTRYIYFNDDPVHDWTKYQAAHKSTKRIMHYLNNRLKRFSGGNISFGGASDVLAASVITSNVQNDRFIAKVLGSAKQSTIRAIAYSIFAETVPSALLFSAAISSVVDYYASPGREQELQKLIRLSISATEDNTNKELMEFIENALAKGRSSSTFHFVFESSQEGARGGKGRNGTPPHLGPVAGKHVVDIRGQGGLMSRELFTKLAPQVIAAIFSLKDLSFSDAPMKFDGGLPVSKDIQSTCQWSHPNTAGEGARRV